MSNVLRWLQHPFFILLIALLFGSFGQIALKAGMSNAPKAGTPLGVLRIIFTQPYVLLGLACYASSTLFYLYVIQRADLSLVYPMVSISYVLVTFLSWALLGERVSPYRLIGLILIVVGVSVLALASNGTHSVGAKPSSFQTAKGGPVRSSETATKTSPPFSH